MVKTRWGSSQGDRLRPTASVRRRRRHVNEYEEHVDASPINTEDMSVYVHRQWHRHNDDH